MGNFFKCTWMQHLSLGIMQNLTLPLTIPKHSSDMDSGYRTTTGKSLFPEPPRVQRVNSPEDKPSPSRLGEPLESAIWRPTVTEVTPWPEAENPVEDKETNDRKLSSEWAARWRAAAKVSLIFKKPDIWMGGKEMVTINQQGEVGGKKQLLK